MEKITKKKGDENVSVIAVANSRFITEIKIKTFKAKKHNTFSQIIRSQQLNLIPSSL